MSSISMWYHRKMFNLQNIATLSDLPEKMVASVSNLDESEHLYCSVADIVLGIHCVLDD